MVVPNHLAIIMDGNRRWAKKKGLTSLEGHKAGFENIKKIAEYSFNRGIKILSVFAFSTENFNRAEEEVKYLMDLFANDLLKYMSDLQEQGIKLLVSGRKDKLRSDVISAIKELTEETKDNKNGIFNICLGYGGRQEIIDATKKIANEVKNGKIDIDSINEDMVNSYLYNDLLPIDLLIRTSGETRVSNFMLWQMAYAEMYFPEVHFPDFNELELDKAIEEFQKRERRFGGNK